MESAAHAAGRLGDRQWARRARHFITAFEGDPVVVMCLIEQLLDDKARLTNDNARLAEHNAVLLRRCRSMTADEKEAATEAAKARDTNASSSRA